MRFHFMLTDRGIRRFKALDEYPRLIAMSRADIQARDGSYTYFNHNMKYLERAETPEQMLEPLLNGNEIMSETKLAPGPLVGVIPDMEYTLFTDTLKEQETCLLFTDGVTEAMNGDKELYGEARLQDFLAAHRGASPRELLTLIFSELVRFRGEEPQSDDITMLAFCRTHSASVAQPASPRTSS